MVEAMTTAGWVALAITIFGALSYATASILQAIGARRSVGTVRAMAHPLYLLGIGCDILAWVGAMIALRELAVYVVESVLAGSLALTVLGARLFLKSRLRKRDAAAVVVTMCALAVMAMSAGPQEPVMTSDTLRYALCAGAFAMVLTGWGAARTGLPGGGVAALAGLSLGGAALVGRSLPMPSGEDTLGTVLGVVTEPLTWALLTFAVTGMTLYAHALQHGEVGPVTAVHWAAEVMAPSAVAVVFLGDTVRPGWGLAALIAGLVTVAAAVLLATAPANHAAARPVEATPQPALPEPAPQHALPAAPAAHPAPAAAAPPAPAGDRIIWWGPPPVWTPPTRSGPARPVPALPAPAPAMATPALPAPAMAALTWEPPPRVQPAWADPYLPDADAVVHPWTWAGANLTAHTAGFPRGRTAWTDAYLPDPDETDIPQSLPVRWSASHPSPPYPAESVPSGPPPAARHPWYDM
jgi:hypothetical protein